ncbi:TetR family transcriptional regulator [Pantoea sp. Bo_2]|uniref:Mycofactocin system transcriptional regulator n=1 Tax=Cronobacter universalis NCTC 9529 TaxID=1074000 RepID=A0AAC9EVQ4_9ENTR|nr:MULTISPECIES: TetR family transcriptional regulator [Gammaproteobacteria]ALB53346.1 TetR family transcriptional regulator [Cronobacter universalis NCTC 9529]ALB70277.1 TetR family transcriptional regulator [Cronobacter muytjensii ATCC 51329]KAA5945758.1 TetR family transcriptional regulator [Pantoea sp. VH_3]KAA5953097.1 TetR family transcriptional regulator [Pantoea sp. VH_25]KAA5953735.1 TetR family transcriptional regulator [Pantoea sp. VH_24]
MTQKNPGLRERHKESTRRELSNLGLALFLKQGFTHTTIEQIVDPLGIARRTFFRYFKTKEDLVFAWHEEKTVQLADELRGRPAEERPLDAVCETLGTVLKLYDANPDMAFALVRLLKEAPPLLAKECEKRMEREVVLAAVLVERYGERGLSLLEARIIVGAATSAWTAALDEWYADGGQANLRPIMARAFSLVREL